MDGMRGKRTNQEPRGIGRAKRAFEDRVEIQPRERGGGIQDAVQCSWAGSDQAERPVTLSNLRSRPLISWSASSFEHRCSR